MLIDFLLDEQPFDKIVFTYIQLQQQQQRLSIVQRSKKEIVLLNSVLVTLAAKKTGLSELLAQVKYALQVNSGDRSCLRRAAQLFAEVIRRSQYIVSLTSPQHIVQIFELSCQKAFITVSGNDFISLINQLSSSIDLSLQQFKPVLQLLFNLATANKLQIISYRQQTRLCLYKVILRILKYYPNHIKEWSEINQNEKKLIERCVNAGEGQKDPRNIGCVFELYLRLFQLFSIEKLDQFKTSMFQNLQAYYPIQFIGDQDNDQHKKINVKQITFMLDQCLCHPFFIEQTWELLSAKTAAAPISKFVPTVLLYLQNRRSQAIKYQFLSRLKSLLIRLTEDSYIEEQYDDDSNDLGAVFVNLLDVIFCRQNGSFSIQSYDILFQWLEIMLAKVIRGQSKQAGTLICIFKSIVKNQTKKRFSSLVCIVRCYSIKVILRSLHTQDELVPKIGLVIAVLSSLQQSNEGLNQLLGLFVLKVGSLYTQVTDQIKMLLLKILLQIYISSPKNRTMIRKANDSFILKDCLSRAQQAFKNSLTTSQTSIIKAFIDFVGVVYLNETELLIQNIKGINYEIQSYLLCRLWQSSSQVNNVIVDKIEDNKQKIIQKFNYLLDHMHKDSQKQGLLQGFKIIGEKQLISLCLRILWPQKQSTHKLIFDILIKLKDLLKHKSDSSQSQHLKSLLACKLDNAQQIINSLINWDRNSQIDQTKQQKLWRLLSNNSTSIHFPLLNQLDLIQFDHFEFQPQYSYFYHPTLIHWQWQQVNSLQDNSLKSKKIAQLLRYLPQKLLLRDSKKIAQFLLKDSSLTTTLLKIAKNLDFKTIKDTGIIDYCLNSIHSIDVDDNGQARKTQSSLSLITILINVVQRIKQEQLKSILFKQIKILKKLALHRKRPIRQASRKLLSLLQQ